MSEVGKYLRLGTLDLGIAEEQLKDAEDGLHAVVEKLEYCLELLAELRLYDPFCTTLRRDSKDTVSV